MLALFVDLLDILAFQTILLGLVDHAMISGEEKGRWGGGGGNCCRAHYLNIIFYSSNFSMCHVILLAVFYLDVFAMNVHRANVLATVPTSN